MRGRGSLNRRLQFRAGDNVGYFIDLHTHTDNQIQSNPGNVYCFLHMGFEMKNGTLQISSSSSTLSEFCF